MEFAIAPNNPLFRKLLNAKTPAQSKKVETISAAAQAWAKEEGDYEAYVAATYTYILARRKTTELLKPFIQHGGDRQGNMPVTLMEKTGFTKMQWHRRVNELDVQMEDLEEYFNECIANGWHPSLAGAVRFAKQGEPRPASHDPVTCPNCGTIIKR